MALLIWSVLESIRELWWIGNRGFTVLYIWFIQWFQQPRLRILVLGLTIMICGWSSAAFHKQPPAPVNRERTVQLAGLTLDRAQFCCFFFSSSLPLSFSFLPPFFSSSSSFSLPLLLSPNPCLCLFLSCSVGRTFVHVKHRLLLSYISRPLS